MLLEFYWEADSKGTPRVWRRTAKKKLRGAVQACKEWLKVNRHKRLPVLLKTLKRKVRGRITTTSALWVTAEACGRSTRKW